MAPIKFFEQASEALFAAAGADTYNRVRQRGLLVLMLLTGLDAAAVAPKAESLIRTVLLPQAKSSDAEVRQACADIARGLAAARGEEAELVPGGGQVGCIWHELCEALAFGSAAEESLNGEVAVNGGPQGVEIEWPPDWR
ncbi:unnamed protein product [Polarella glacialis]|uniref:Uncharacterized protein n=1 Tax=Polarella glacialis TaxID=89957 RepID=A0A813EG19_POLGL|nr:unnamed protein product [Polarella glacialis]